jgi:hypothetical protein
MRQVPLRLIFTLAFAATTVAAKDAATATLPDWMAGHWCSQGESEQGEEDWLPAAGGLMMGMSRTVAVGRKTQFEFLRIELIDGVPTYIALPQGGSSTAFKKTDGNSHWIRFENREHDFPQRIEYRRSGDALHAEIAGPGENGKELVIPFEFTRCAD